MITIKWIFTCEKIWFIKFTITKYVIYHIHFYAKIYLTNFVYIKLENPPRSEKEHFFLLRFLWLLQGKCQKHIKVQANVCWRNAKPTMNYDRYSIKDDCEINFLPHFPPKSFCQIARQSLTRKISTNLKGVVWIMEQNPVWSYNIILFKSIFVIRFHEEQKTIFKTYI